MKWFFNTPFAPEADTGGGGGGAAVLDPGVPFEHGNEPEKPAEKKAEPSGTDKEIADLRKRVEDQERRTNEALDDAKFWANRAQRGEPRRAAEEEEEPARKAPRRAAAEEKPEKLLDEMTVDGLEALKKRGVITADELEARLKKITTDTKSEIAATRKDAEFGIKISKEFPEIAEDSERIAKGERPKTELFKRAGEIYRAHVAEDPDLQGSQSLLLMASRQAKAELAAKAASGEADEEEVLPDARTERQTRRRERIEAQTPPRSTRRTSRETDDTPEVSSEARDVMKHLKVDEDTYVKHAAGAGAGGRRGR